MEDTSILKASDFLLEEEPLLSLFLGNIRNAMINRSNLIAGRYGFTMRQFLVVSYISQHENEVVTQKTLEDKMHLSNPTITVLIQTMMKKGLVYRERVPEDGRKYRLRLTDQLKETYDQCSTDMYNDQLSIYAGITEEEKQQLFSIFRKLEANLGYSTLSES